MQDIYVGDTGEGFPLVLVHGFLGSSKMWEPQVNFFKKHFRVITPDLPGFGKSNKAKPYNNINDMAQTILDCLKEKKIEKFYLLGHSMGGMIVQEMAKLAGERIIKLICYGTGPVGDIPGRFETMEVSRKKLKRDGLEITAHRIAKTWFVDYENSKGYYICLEESKKATQQAALASLTAWEKWNGLKQLLKINCPTLIIWSDKDKSYDWTQQQALKEGIKDSEIIVIKNCAHNAHMEKPLEFNEILLNFLKKN